VFGAVAAKQCVDRLQAVWVIAKKAHPILIEPLINLCYLYQIPVYTISHSKAVSRVEELSAQHEAEVIGKLRTDSEDTSATSLFQKPRVIKIPIK
jgi:hypothetical protein